MGRLQDPRLQLEYQTNTRDQFGSFLIFRNNIPWWPDGFQPKVYGRYRPCVQRIFWDRSTDNWREELSPVIKRRGFIYLIEIGKQRKLALAILINNLGHFQGASEMILSDEQRISELNIPVPDGEPFSDKMDWRRACSAPIP